MNHRWQNDKCVKCGLKRKKKSWSKCMAVLDNGKDVWAYGKDYFYLFEGKWKMMRPNCRDDKNCPQHRYNLPDEKCHCSYHY